MSDIAEQKTYEARIAPLDTLRPNRKGGWLVVCDEHEIDTRQMNIKQMRAALEKLAREDDSIEFDLSEIADDLKQTAKKPKKTAAKSSEQPEEQPEEQKDLVADPGNSIVSCVNACHNIMRNENSIVGEKAMHDIMRLLFLKFLEPMIDSGAVDIMDQKYYGKNDEHYVPDMERLAKFSQFRGETLDNSDDVTEDLWKSILSKHPLTSEIFPTGDFWNCKQEVLSWMIAKVDTTLKEANFDKLDHDVKGRLYEEFLNGYSNNAGKAFGQYFTTRDYIRLIFDQIPQDQVKRWKKKIVKGQFKVLDPCMGTGGFLTEAFAHFGLTPSMLFGHEIEAETYTYALMNMILTTGTLNSENFTRCDSLIESDPRVEFNFIPTNPPYGTKMNYIALKGKYEAHWAGAINEDDGFPTWKEIFPVKTNNGVALFLQYIAFKLKPGGMALAIVPDGQILFGENFAKLRKYLMTQVDIVQIMYTPGGVFKHAGVKTAVIWMRRPRKGVLAKAPVKFMETTKQLTKPTPIAEISFDEMEENNWSWDASYYKAQEIPNWNCEWKPLGEVCESSNGQSLKKSEIKDGEYPVIGGGQKPMGFHSVFNTPENTILCSSSGAYAGYFSRYPSKVWKSDCFSIEPTDQTHPEYVWMYLKCMQDKIYEFQTGAGQPHVYWSDLSKFKIPVPSLEIQAAIVAELDELEAMKDGIRGTIAGLKSALEKFRRHVNPPFGEYRDQIKWKTLGEVCEIAIGGTPARSNPAYWNGNHVWVSVSELNNREIHDSKEKITDLGISKSSTKLVNAGTILMSFKLSIGKMGIAGCDLYTNEAIVAISPCKELMRMYIYHYLGNKTTFATSGSIGVGNLNKESIRKIQLPVPSLEIQEEFVKFYEDKEEEIKQMMKEIANLEARIVRLDDLGRSIIKNMICA